MKIVKTRMRNKMEDEFLLDNLVVYIEKEITENFTTDSILDDFRSLKELRLQFWTKMFSFYVIVCFATLPILYLIKNIK